ncbi:MAG: LCP family protein [Ilumatobacter sp.]
MNDVHDGHAPRKRRRRRSSAPLGLLFALVVALAGSVGLISASERLTENFQRFEQPEQFEEVLVAVDGPAVNYLLIGSDSREGTDPNAADAGAVGDVNDVTGRRSDTIIVLRQERNGEGAALLSLNRDLWVTQADTGQQDRINSAYNRGVGVLAQTITQEYGIPINHVVDIDFVGFRDLVDTIGGVTICFEFETRDQASGLVQPPGCNLLDGTQALAYARSRRYQEFRDGQWREDPTSDLGRVQRQQQFLAAAVNETLLDIAADPALVRDLFDATSGSLRLDAALDPLGAAGTLRKAFSSGLTTYTLPVRGETIDGKAVLTVIDGPETDEILNYFRGVGPLPAPETTVPG